MASFDLVIRNGTALTPDGEKRADIGVEGGRIAEIAGGIQGEGKEEIDANGLHIFPGVIDSHVHFNEPGRTDWEGFATGSAALAAGGGTCFFDMPLNASPPTLDAASFRAKKLAAEQSSLTDFGLWGGLTPGNLERMEELAECGVIGFKAFMCNSGIEDFSRADDLTLYRGMRNAAKLGLLVAVHAESEEITAGLTQQIRARGGESWADYLESRPAVAELEAIQRALFLAGETGCSLHVVHVSTPRGVELVRRAARELGIDATCETCPHYLLLNAMELSELGARAKCSPPLRAPQEVKQMWELLLAGEIDLLASDHSPAPQSMKQGDDVFAMWGGIAGVQTTLVGLLGQNGITAGQLAALLSANVARRYAIEAKGKLAIGFDADMALVDLSARHVLEREQLLDRHRLSPYVGRRMRARVARTISGGRTIFLNGKANGQGGGKLVVGRFGRENA